MDGIEIARDLRVGLVREGCIKTNGSFVLDEIITITGQWCDNAFRTAMTLNICQDGVAMRIILLELDASDLNQSLELISDEDLP